jgi:polyhydroxyalkanoate synthesis regulator phasin
MSEQVDKQRAVRWRDIPQDVMHRGREMAGLGRDIWLAGLGAVATMEEDGPQIFERLIGRGKKVEAHGREEITERQQEVSHTVGESIYDPLVAALRRVGVSTGAEIHELGARVESLAQKVDELVEQLTVKPPADKGAVQLKGLKLFKVVARGGEWAVDREGRQRALSVHTTKAEATERARALAHSQLPSRLEIYKEDGTLQETFTYPQ